jgi:hypothetical protein
LGKQQRAKIEILSSFIVWIVITIFLSKSSKFIF